MNISKSIVVGILSIAAVEAQATAVVSSAAFQESSLLISASNGASIVSALETSFLVDAFTPFRDEFLLGSTSSISSILVDTYANGKTVTIGEFGDPDQSAQTTVENAGLGSVVTMREWEIEISGAGTLSVDVDYLLAGDILNGIEGDAKGFGAVEILFEGSNIKANDDFFITDKDSIGDEEFLAFFPTLSISKSVTDGEFVTLTMLASSSADAGISAVPVPAALPLFASALAGMGFVRLGRKKA